jgi:hypothetical protein
MQLSSPASTQRTGPVAHVRALAAPVLDDSFPAPVGAARATALATNDRRDHHDSQLEQVCSWTSATSQGRWKDRFDLLRAPLEKALVVTPVQDRPRLAPCASCDLDPLSSTKPAQFLQKLSLEP